MIGCGQPESRHDSEQGFAQTFLRFKFPYCMPPHVAEIIHVPPRNAEERLVTASHCYSLTI